MKGKTEMEGKGEVVYKRGGAQGVFKEVTPVHSYGKGSS